MISPRPLDERTLEELVARMRQPQRAPRRPARPARRQPRRRASACASSRARVGVERLREATDAVLDYSERRTRACLAALPDGDASTREDVLEAPEGDLVLRLRAVVDGERLLLDFTGSAPQHDGNLNCPLAVTRSACLFAVRVLTDPDIPPTAGAYRPIEVRVPAGHAAQRPPRGGRRGAATSRPPRASPTSCSAPSDAPRARAR